jgi:hypothetical protein
VEPLVLLELLLLLDVLLDDELVLVLEEDEEDEVEEVFDDPLEESNKEFEEVREVQSYFEKHFMTG